MVSSERRQLPKKEEMQSLHACALRQLKKTLHVLYVLSLEVCATEIRVTRNKTNW